MLARRGMTHARAMRKRPNIAVVGAGWAGLACARLLQDNGFQVKVFEASRTIGGRARGLQVKLGAETYDLDNGQHLLIGAYRAVRALLTRYGNPQTYRFDAPDFRIRFQRASSSQSISQPMSQTMSQPMQLAKSGWPRQLHRMLATDPRPAGMQQSNQLLDRLALGLSQLSWLSGARSIPWPSLLELAALMRYARLQPPPMSCSVTSWLSGLGLRQSLVQRWIAALCESALNCPFDEACAMRLATVLNEAMASPQFDASDWMHQACDLSELLANGLAQGSAATTAKSEASALELYTANRVVGLTASPSSGDQAFTTHTWKLAIAGSDEHVGPFDALILALEPQSALALAIASQGTASDPPRCLLRLHKLLDNLPKPLGILTRWLMLPDATRHCAGSNKRHDGVGAGVFRTPEALKPELLLKAHGPSAWLFPRSNKPFQNASSASDSSQAFGLVISAQRDPVQARSYADAIQEDFDLRPLSHKDVYEHRAATPSVAQRMWPAFNHFESEGLWLAGDWVADNSGQMLPASLESALRSAFACAQAIESREWQMRTGKRLTEVPAYAAPSSG
ncbi:MAG: hypothetical protein EBW19_07490 [Betaproteobacteria bacterium]|nr:hypothetical protein [Betaproteobacteria bacterium]